MIFFFFFAFDSEVSTVIFPVGGRMQVGYMFL